MDTIHLLTFWNVCLHTTHNALYQLAGGGDGTVRLWDHEHHPSPHLAKVHGCTRLTTHCTNSQEEETEP